MLLGFGFMLIALIVKVALTCLIVYVVRVLLVLDTVVLFVLFDARFVVVYGCFCLFWLFLLVSNWCCGWGVCLLTLRG